MKMFDVIEARHKSRPASVRLDVDEGIRVSLQALDGYAFARWQPLCIDLLALSAAIEYADRSVTRPSQGWARNFSIRIAVIDYMKWTSPEVRTALTETLVLLTGDCWEFQFTKRARSSFTKPEKLLELKEECKAVIPFSNGMDSMAVAAIQEQELGAALMKVRVGEKTAWERAKKGQRTAFARVPYKLEGLSRRESSARSRGFKFAIVAGLAAYLVEANRVVLPESGQGSIGPVIALVGHGYADYRNHPQFAALVGQFLTTVFGVEIRFEIPRLWNTKGETLKEYMRLTGQEDWRNTRSCWRNSVWSSFKGRRRQCGVCAACMLRRVSVHTAGAEENPEGYICPDLGAPTVQAAVRRGYPRPNNAFVAYANAGALHMQHLADLASDRYEQVRRTQALAIAKAMGRSCAEVSHDLRRLLTAHAGEWESFKATLGARSYIQSICKANP